LLDFGLLLLLIKILHTFCKSINVGIKLLQKPLDINLYERLVDFGASLEYRLTLKFWLRVRRKSLKNIFEVFDFFEETDQSLVYDHFKLC